MNEQNLPGVHVINGRQKKLLQGHPWVYGNEIERVEGEIVDGGLVTVVGFRGRYMGTGFYNSKSLITVRLLTHRSEEITDSLIAARVKAACDYRRFVMSRPGTDSCRLIYGEADRLPGVIADRFGDVVVLQVLALGMEKYTQVIADALVAEIESFIQEMGAFHRLVIRYDVRQEYLEESLRKVFMYLHRLTMYVRPIRLNQIRTSFAVQNALAMDSVSELNTLAGWAWVAGDVSRADLDAQASQLADLSAEELLDAAQTIFKPENLVISIQRDPAVVPGDLSGLLAELRVML